MEGRCCEDSRAQLTGSLTRSPPSRASAQFSRDRGLGEDLER